MSHLLTFLSGASFMLAVTSAPEWVVVVIISLAAAIFTKFTLEDGK